MWVPVKYNINFVSNTQASEKAEQTALNAVSQNRQKHENYRKIYIQTVSLPFLTKRDIYGKLHSSPLRVTGPHYKRSFKKHR